jgi:hypothetical protein
MKSARVDVAVEVVQHCQPVLEARGIEVVAVDPTPGAGPRSVRLTVRGDALPDFCEDVSPPPLVRVEFTQREEGGARVMEVSKIEAIEDQAA